MESKNNWKAWLYLAPVIILMAIFTFYPLINTIVISFLKDYEYITGSNSGFTFENYGVVLGITGKTLQGQVYYMRDYVDTALPNTLLITFITVPISILLALAISICLNSIKWLSKIFQTIFFLPYVTNAIAVGMVFTVIFSYDSGVINFLFHLGNTKWVDVGADKVHAMFALCVYIIWKSLPYKILIFLSGLQGIDKQYYEAAKIDATPKWKVAWKITIPLLSPQILYVMITSFIGAFKEYDSIVGLFGRAGTESSQGTNMMTVVYYIYNNIKAGSTGAMSYAAAGAVILFLIILLFTLIQMWVSNKRVHY